MREITKAEIGDGLRTLIEEKDPIDDDIAIVDESGDILSVLINKDAYNFFLKKVHEEEDKQDRKTVEDFHKNGEQ